MSPAQSTPQLALFDLTSDTATVPTDAMFEIMKAASRGDDVFSADDDVNSLEAYVAEMLGQEAALFCVSGTMSNQLGLRCLLTQPPHSVLCDARGHIFVHECGGISVHSQASVTPVMPKNGIHLTAAEVEANICSDTLTGAPTRVIALENTLNGTILPFEEMKRICALADARGIKKHLDGARLWNASAATGIPLHEYGRLFDSVSVCLSKGVGAPIGSILAGSREMITRARHIRKMMGGGWRQAGMLAAAARYCIDTVVPTMPQTHELAARLADHLQSLGIRLALPCHTNMLFIDTADAGITVADLAADLLTKNIRINANGGTVTRIVLHYQITPKAIDDFMAVATRVVTQANPNGLKIKEHVKPVSHPVNSVPDLTKAYPTAK